MSPVGYQAKLEAATEKFVRSKELLKAAKMQEQHEKAHHKKLIKDLIKSFKDVFLAEQTSKRLTKECLHL